MRARVPLDVDLEDRLLYGLTPIRLAYVVLAGLAALAIWSSSWIPAPCARTRAAIAAASRRACWRGVAGVAAPPTPG